MSNTAALTLQPRQDRSVMDITSMEIGDVENVIHLEATMGAYGKVYSTIRFRFNADRSGGTYQGQGRGFIDEDTMVAGAGVGIWRREGSKAYLEEVVSISDGTQNLHRGTLDMLKKTLVVDAYVLT